MRARQIILFILIVVLPLLVAGWLGLKVARDEQALGKHQFDALLESRLADVEETIARSVSDLEVALLVQVLVDVPREPDEIRAMRRTRPLVRELFVLDGDGAVVFPPEGDDASAEERAFRVRTASIWSHEAVLHTPPERAAVGDEPRVRRAARDAGAGGDAGAGDAGASDAGASDAGARGRTRGRQSVAGRGDSVIKLARTRSHGWIAWYWEDGLHLLFWRRADGGGVVGAEIERIALLARIVGKLPTAEPGAGRIALLDSRGAAIHQWGLHEPRPGERPVASRPVRYPLDAWRLAYYASPGQVTLSGSQVRLNLIFGLCAVAIALCAMAWFLYRDYAERMRDAAQRVSFVTQVSHELKTPLANIRLYAELLEGEIEEDDPAHERLAVIVSESQRLTRLINNILTFSKQGRGPLEVRRQPVDVDQVVAEVLQQFAPALAVKDIEWTHRAGCAGPIDTDADAVGQIVANLVSNVEKYGADGNWLEVTTTRQDDAARVVVADRGPGIPREHAAGIFRPFYRVSDKLSDGVTGTGIGLAIARALAERLGGSLTLEPSERGARFALVIPTGEAPADEPADGPPDEPADAADPAAERPKREDHDV